MIKKKCTKKILKDSLKNKTKKKSLKHSTKPSRSGRPEGRPAETGLEILKTIFFNSLHLQGIFYTRYALTVRQ